MQPIFLAETPCPVCREALAVSLARRDRHWRPLHTVLCVRCGHGRVDPLPESGAFAQWHGREYRRHYKGNPTASYRLRRADRVAASRAAQLAAALGPGEGRRLLDAGCGHGLLLPRLQAQGWHVQGIEPDTTAAALAAQRVGRRAHSSLCFCRG